MTWREYSKVLEDIAAKWGRLGILPEASAKQYFTDLSDLPVELVMRAVEAIYRNGEKYPPTGWRIRIAALEIDAIAAMPTVERKQTPELDQVWAGISALLESQVPDDVRRAWLGGVHPYALETPTLYLEAPAKQLEWIRRRFGPMLQAAATRINDKLERVELLPERGAQA